MVQDAEKFAEEDKKRRDAAEAKNNADSLVHATEKQLEEHGDKIDAGLKSEIEAALAEAKTALEGDDVEAIKAKAQALTELAMKMGQAIYEKEQACGRFAGRRRRRRRRRGRRRRRRRRRVLRSRRRQQGLIA